MPQISVIIPLYNKADYIRRALDSVFAQTFQKFEVIVVDDGSTDDGPKIVAGYDKSRFQLLRQKNAGPGAARNRGIRAAQGKYVAFLDADDEWLPEYLEKSYETLEKNKTCDFSVSGWYQDYSQHPEGLRNVNIIDGYIDIFKKSFGGIWEINSKIPDHILSNFIQLFSTNTVFVRTDIIRKYNGFLETHNYGEDIYLWLQLMFNHSFFYIDSPLAWYHDNVSSLGGEFWKRPLPAYFFFSEKLYEECIAKNQKIIERWFALKALQEAHNRLSAGKIEDVKYLLGAFPRMKIIKPWSYIKLILKFKIPSLRKKKEYI